MSNQSVINPRNIILAATLASLISMTPICAGTSYEFYDYNTPEVSLTDQQFASALESLMAAYRKETPDYTIKGAPFFAKVNEQEFLLLIYPYHGGCNSACYPVLMKKGSDGNLSYVQDFERLNCREKLKGPAKLICDHSSGPI